MSELKSLLCNGDAVSADSMIIYHLPKHSSDSLTRNFIQSSNPLKDNESS